MYLAHWSKILIAATLTLVVFILRNRNELIEIWEDLARDINEDIYTYIYGSCGKVYAIATKKNLQVGDIIIKRNNKVKFFVPFKNTYVEGIFVGVDRAGLLYVRMDNNIDEDSGEAIMYEANCLEKKHLVYVKPLR